MKRLDKYIAAVGISVLLCANLCGCDEVFVPVDESDETNPYLYWEETSATSATEETLSPGEEGVVGYVTGKFLNIRSGPGTQYDVLGVLNMGNQVRIYEQRTVDGTLWGLTETGWVSMSYVSLSGNATSVIGTITAKTLNIRSGPGTGYESVGVVSKGDQVVILEQTTISGKTWGRIEDGWISMQYVSVEIIGASTSVTTYTAVVTGKTLNIRSGAGTDYGVVGTLSKGDKITILEQTTVNGKEWGRIEQGWISMSYVEITETVITPVDTPTSNTVADTSIVGSWVCMNEQDYFNGGSIEPATWTFHEDGSFSYTQYAYTVMENIGWQGTSGGSEKAGTYSFDGSTLNLRYAGTGTTDTLSVSITNNTMAVYGHRTYSTMLRTYDVNALIKALIKNKYAASDTSIRGSWTGVDTDTFTADSLTASAWYFGSDGSFSQTVTGYLYDSASGYSPASGSTVYSGYYFYDGSRLTLCYETATDGSTWITEADVRYVICENVTISGTAMEMTDIHHYLLKNSDVNAVASQLG